MIMSLAWDTSSEVVNTSWERFSPGPIGLPRRLSDRTFRVCFRDIVRDGGQVDADPDRLWPLYEATLLSDLDDKGSLLLHSALGAWGIAKFV
ncbi:hypothetical protein [Mesorhizobium sp.]|uniref:hypothetical protein n=1 Tax=Mesorhizobium sp. TaxID=1871066 RepID=UPI000FE854E3|nr:hypothetical protein [Mesorhizobium sp.]RWD96396.1 MAG: hypothetical protein EOS40_33090 [Mesorhizobium sp.]